MSNPFANGGQDPYQADPQSSAQQPYIDPYAQQGYPQQGYYQQGYPQPNALVPHAAPGYPAVGYAPKSKIAAALLAFFLGSLGVHNFYLGYNGKAWTQLGLTIFGYVTAIFLIGFLFILGVGIWAFVEFIMILAGGGRYRTDAKGVPLTN
ncbi:TM2 domain-containing protein [Corynebacterium terpenotabidum]|uniref:TM2 domain-containing protein n=1 Tax=Corynebacterium terpenotabidum Y-11 TaxID=1200352 RepID=S4XHZ8_9CORY|nr:TM2 domain-containing protein [Corynebacterium terpenotabidum]AGP31315.1 hypothetical protein A606_08350 [Corynebacterium terpenotabidum Y-11]